MESSTEAVKTNIVVLTGEETFSVWQFQVKLALDGMDIFDVVDGSYPKPEGNPESIQRWLKKDKKAKNIIGTTVAFNLVKQIMYCDTAQEMWEKLHSVFNQKSQTGVHILQKKFFTLEKEQGDSMAEHIAKLEDIAHRLSALGEPISKSMLMTKILLSLPSAYGHFHVAWDSTEDKDKTLHNLRSRLMSEEARLMLEDNHLDTSNIAMYCKFCKKQGHDKKSCFKKKKEIKCRTCGKHGHFSYECNTVSGDDVYYEEAELF